MDTLAPKPFKEAALRAFPSNVAPLAHEAASELTPFVDDTYRQNSDALNVTGKMVAIPRRLHFVGLSACKDGLGNFSLASRCLITRSTDGYLRQQALRSIIDHQSVWIAPFVLILLGEYVVEIVKDIRDALPALDQSVYANLIRENQQAVQLLRERAISYWDAYYRQRYRDKQDYPGLQALQEMATWAT